MEIKVKEMPIDEKPREKAFRYGIESLSNRELIAILLRNGYAGVSVLELSDHVLQKANGLGNLASMPLNELMEIKGISKVKALELMTCFELSKRVSSQVLFSTLSANSPSCVAEYMNKKIGNKQQEHFVVLFLDTKNQLIKEETIFIGSLNKSVIHAREIFKAAIANSSAKIMLVHNHPSKVCIPSEQDIKVTARLLEAGKLVGIEVLDHIIVGGNTYYSFKEHQLME